MIKIKLLYLISEIKSKRKILKIILLLFFVNTLFSCQNNSAEISNKIPSTKEAQPKKEITQGILVPQKEPQFFPVDVDSIIFKNNKMYTTLQKMQQVMGKPDSIIEPKYECGIFSEDWQGVKFYQYFYGEMNYIVSEGQAEIERIIFDKNTILFINGIELNSKMTFDEVIKALKIMRIDTKNKSIIEIHPKRIPDEYFYLKFKDDKLFQFDRYAPC